MAVAPVLAVEREVDAASHVGGGHEGADEPEEEDVGVVVLHGPEQDLVLGPEAGEREDPGQGQGADDEGPVRGRHVLLEPAHLAHVVGMHGVDDRPGAEEQQGLEEGVGEEVEDAGRPGADAEGGHHVTQLADGGVGQDAFDVVLHEGQAGGDDHRDPGDERHPVEPAVADGEARPEHAVDPGHEVHAGHDHGGGVDQGRHRRGAGHGVGQPDVERELGTLAHHAEEQQQGAGQEQAVGDVVIEGQPVDRLDVEGLPGGEEQRDGAQHQADIAELGGEEGLEGG